MNQCKCHQEPLHQCKSKYEIAIWISRLIIMTISIRLRRHIQGLIPMWVLELLSIRSKLIFVTIQFGFLRLETHMDTAARPLLIISIVFYKGRSRDNFFWVVQNNQATVNSIPNENSGADPGFFLGGGALVSCSTSTPINHIVFFFCRIPVVLENRRSSQGGCAPPAPSP